MLDKLRMTKYLASISLCQGGTMLSCRKANYAVNEAIAVYMFITDLYPKGDCFGQIELIDSEGSITWWVFERGGFSDELEIYESDCVGNVF